MGQRALRAQTECQLQAAWGLLFTVCPQLALQPSGDTILAPAPAWVFVDGGLRGWGLDLHSRRQQGSHKVLYYRPTKTEECWRLISLPGPSPLHQQQQKTNAAGKLDWGGGGLLLRKDQGHQDEASATMAWASWCGLVTLQWESCYGKLYRSRQENRAGGRSPHASSCCSTTPNGRQSGGPTREHRPTGVSQGG